MSDEPLPQSEDGAPIDPFEAELVAYLDGELEPGAARKVELRLAIDPAARAKAAALKKTFDLLDYLPKPEPSATFTTRTLDKIPALKSSSNPVLLPSRPIPGSSTPLNASLSVPIALSAGALALQAAAPARRWIRAASILAAVAGLAAAGYLGAAAIRPHLFATPNPRDPVPDDLPLSDHRLIEDLPLYAAADDLDFVQHLADSDLFADESAIVSAGPKGAAPPVDPDKPSGPAFEALARSFKTLPPQRQQAIRDIDRQLHAKLPAVRDKLFRVLEAYAVWLDRLPESERKDVLAAATPELRIGVVRDIRERQWIDGLPPAQRKQLTGLNPTQKGERIQQWKTEEQRQRNLWAFARKNSEALPGNKSPWPFDTESGRKDVIEFVRAAYRPDDSKRCRFTPADLAGYREALAGAEKNGAWAVYGMTVHELSARYETLPEPADSRMIVDFETLPPAVAKLVERPGLRKKLTPYIGKWPDFPLELHDELKVGKFGPGLLLPLGPARIADFKEAVRACYEKELQPKLTQQERGTLKLLEYRWPDYPRKFMEIARYRDVSVPGVMLPGPPSRWDATYGAPPRPSGRP